MQGQDIKIQQYADKFKLDYDTAKKVLAKRGYQEVLPVQEQEEPSMLEEIGQTGLDVGRGALSGLTFGGLEELTAAAKAKLSSEKGDFETLYKKYLEIEEQKEREAKERSPYASFAGEVLGGLAPAAFTGGASLLPTAGTAAAKLGGRELLKAAGRGALTAAGTGAIGGAVSGGLASEGGLIGATEEEKEKLLEDVQSGALFGAATGGVFGAGAPFAAKGFKAAKELGTEALESTLFGRHLKKAFKMGREGESVLREVGAKQSMLKEADVANKLTDQLLELEEAAAKEFKDPLNFASKAGKTVSLVTDNPEEVISAMQKAGAPSKLITKAKGLLFPSEAKSSGLMGAMPEKITLSPYEAYEFRKQLQEEAAKRPELKGILGNIINHIDERIESVFDDPAIKKGLAEARLPGSYKEGLNSYRNFVSSGIESIIEQGRPGKPILTAEQEALRRAGKLVGEPSVAARGTRFRDFQFPEKQLQTKVTDILETLNLPSESRKGAVTALYGKGGFVPMLTDLMQKKPEAAMRIAKKAGFSSPDEMIKKITSEFEEQSLESAVRKIISGTDTTESVTPRKIFSEGSAGLEALGRRSSAGLSMATGVGVRGLEKVAKTTPVKIARSIYKLPDTGLLTIADKLKQSTNKTFSSFGENLTKAIENGDTVKKQAVLFALMQNPEFRSQFSTEEEE